jgi:uncharacterized membrane protein
MPYLLAIASAVFYGSADFLGGLATRRAAAIPVVLISQAVGLVLVVLLLPALPAATPDRADIAWGAVSGLAGGVGVALLYYALSIGTMSVVAPTTAVCAVAIPVLTSIALGERPGAVAIVGILVGVAAIVLVSLQAGPEQSSRAQRLPLSGAKGGICSSSLPSGLGVALCAGVAIGLFLLTLAQSKRSSGLWPLVSARAVSVTLIAVIAAARRTSLRMPAGVLGFTLAGGALDMLANALYLLAAQIGPLSPVVTLSSLYPATTVLLAGALLRERLNMLQRVGVGLALVAVVLIVRAPH